tara:strand:+ start:177 stop:1082 length:906 start_codon:yes stop_codon:yes gene_type:complete
MLCNILIVVILSIVFLILIKYLSNKNINKNINENYKNYRYIKNKNKNNKNAIIVLTRGYKTLKEYNKLITRNKYIQKYFNPNIDYLIFHEGNIPSSHQKYIYSKTPKLNLKFINVSNEFKWDIPCKEACSDLGHLNTGYRNMCRFWIIGFWKYVKSYNKVFRIDEDCNYYSDYNKIFKLLNNKVCVYGLYTGDEDYVTIGLNNFTRNFLKKNNGNNRNNIESRNPSGPYTNVIGFNLEKLRENQLLKRYLRDLDKSNNIYYYRWGDLPLWGEVLHYMYNKDDYLETKDISYYHGSHGNAVN